jgi:hypothetical protein
MSGAGAGGVGVGGTGQVVKPQISLRSFWCFFFSPFLSVCDFFLYISLTPSPSCSSFGHRDKFSVSMSPETLTIQSDFYMYTFFGSNWTNLTQSFTSFPLRLNPRTRQWIQLLFSQPETKPSMNPLIYFPPRDPRLNASLGSCFYRQSSPATAMGSVSFSKLRMQRVSHDVEGV